MSADEVVASDVPPRYLFMEKQVNRVRTIDSSFFTCSFELLLLKSLDSYTYPNCDHKWLLDMISTRMSLTDQPTDGWTNGRTDIPSCRDICENASKKKPGWIHGTRCVLFTFENNTGPSYGLTDGRTDTTSYRDATAHLKIPTF